MKTNTPELQKNKDKTFVLNLTLPKANINSTYTAVIKSVKSDFETKGFRKGKVPDDIVKANISETKIIEEVLTRLISTEYTKKVKENDLHPIIQPQVKVLNPPVDLKKDWEIELTGCELPEIKLDPKYVEDVKKVNLSKDDENKKINATIESLLKHSTVTVPEILIKADVDNKLAQLVEQTQQAGLTINQYLKSRHQTLEQYQKILEQQVKNEWITNLAIDSIAKTEKLDITETEVNSVISQNPQLAQNPNMVYYLLTQQKVFDLLKKL